MHRVSLLSCHWALQPLWDILADAGFLFNKDAMPSDTINRTLLTMGDSKQNAHVHHLSVTFKFTTLCESIILHCRLSIILVYSTFCPLVLHFYTHIMVYVLCTLLMDVYYTIPVQSCNLCLFLWIAYRLLLFIVVCSFLSEVV